MLDEIWKPIPSFPGYEVSSHGRVRNKSKILSIGTTFDGYKRCSLKRGAAWLTRTIHPLMLEAFVSKRPKGMDACHNDGNPSNNRLSNLRWDTRRNNCMDMFKHGTGMRLERHANAKLTNEQVLEARRRFANGEKGYNLAKEFGVCRSTMYKAISHKNPSGQWKTLKRLSPTETTKAEE